MMKTCSIQGCEKPHFGNGLCSMHYSRVRIGCSDMRPGRLPHHRFGKKWPSDDPRYKNKGRLCDVPGCEKPFYAKGLCHNHHEKLSRNGFLACSVRFPEKCSVKDCDEEAKAKGLCNLHYNRLRRGIQMDRPKGIKGNLNPRWNGGTAQYPNHYKMKQIRLEVLKEFNYTCFSCGKNAKQIHHLDHSKNNHSKENLVACCNKCNLQLASLKLGGRKTTSKFIRLYGKTAKQLASDLGVSSSTIHNLHRASKVRSYLYDADIMAVLR